MTGGNGFDLASAHAIALPRRQSPAIGGGMNLYRSIVTVSGFTAISRVLGFIRDMLTAAVLGAGPIADAFFVAFRLPNLFRSLFAEGASIQPLCL